MCNTASQSCGPGSFLATSKSVLNPQNRFLWDLITCYFFLVDVDILKPDTGYLSVIERPATSTSSPFNSSSGKGATPARSSGSGSDAESPVLGAVTTGYTEPLSEGEEDETYGHCDEEDEDESGSGEGKVDKGKKRKYGRGLEPAREEDLSARTGLSGDDVKAAVEYREQMLRVRKEEEEEERKREKKAGKERVEDGGEMGDGEGEEGEGAGLEERRHRHKFGRQRSLGISKQALSIDPLAPSLAFDETLKTKLEGEEAKRRADGGTTTRGSSTSRPRGSRSVSRTSKRRLADYGLRNDQEEDERPADVVEEEAALNGKRGGEGDERILERKWRAPAGKLIAIPVRIEPKVYFAAERTFLVGGMIV